jgi:hypothetical protein
MVRKAATRNFPWSIAAEVNLVLPPSHPSPPPQYEDLPVAKRPRLQTSTADRMSTAAGADSDPFCADEHSITDSDKDNSDSQSIADAATPDDKVIVVPTHPLTLASLPKDELDPTPTAVVAPVQNGNKGKWSPKEDELLNEAVQKHGRKWVPIAAMVPGRTNPQCRSRWLRHLDPTNGKKGRWTPEEDAILIEAVGKLGKDFTAVAALIPGRTNDRCRDRWGRWTPEEDAILIEAVEKLGKDFTAVAALIPGRTDDRCRDRWVRCLDVSSNEGIEKGTWAPEEDAKLIEAVQKLGRHWVPVAALVCTRTNIQCRQRWLDDLDRYRGKVRSPRKKRTLSCTSDDE